MMWYKKVTLNLSKKKHKIFRERKDSKMGQRSYTPEYRADAVELSKSIGTSEAARQLKMPVDTLYTWISRAKQGDLPLSTVRFGLK